MLHNIFDKVSAYTAHQKVSLVNLQTQPLMQKFENVIHHHSRTSLIFQFNRYSMIPAPAQGKLKIQHQKPPANRPQVTCSRNLHNLGLLLSLKGSFLNENSQNESPLYFGQCCLFLLAVDHGLTCYHVYRSMTCYLDHSHIFQDHLQGNLARFACWDFVY